MSREGAEGPPDPGGGRETGIYGRFLDQHALVDLAGTQHLVLGLTQMRQLGLSDSAVHKRAATGHLHRVHRGVYSLVPPQLMTLRARLMAAVLACGPGAVLSHRSAAQLHGIRPTERARIEVTVPRRSSQRHAGLEIHRSTTLTPPT